MAAYALYRGTTCGTALDAALNEMIDDGLLPKNLATKVMAQFDKSFNKSISRLPKEKMTFCATQLLTYRYCDNVWTFVFNNVALKDPHRSFDFPIQRLKIVACDGRQQGMLGGPPLTSGAGPSSKKGGRQQPIDDSDDSD